jgi:hypothetical protein
MEQNQKDQSARTSRAHERRERETVREAVVNWYSFWIGVMAAYTPTVLLMTWMVWPRAGSNAVIDRLYKPPDMVRRQHPKGLHPAADRIGWWLAAALDDPNVCEEFKADIRAWFDAGMPT